MLSILYAITALCAIGYSENEVAGTAGYRFVVFMDPGYAVRGQGSARVQITLTPCDVNGAIVSVKCPGCSSSIFVNSDKFVFFGHSHTLELLQSSVSQTNGPTGSQLVVGVDDQSVLIESTALISVMMSYNAKKQDPFLALVLPVRSLFNKYIITNFDERGRLAVIAVTTGQTTIYLQRSDVDMLISCGAGQNGSAILQQFQVWFAQCNFLTGILLYASNPVAVFIGNAEGPLTSPQDKSKNPPTVTSGLLMEQALPLSACGKKFIVPGKIMTNMADGFLRILPCYSNVTVTFKSMHFYFPNLGSSLKREIPAEGGVVECTIGCQVTMFTYSTSAQSNEVAGNSMTQLIPVRFFTHFVTFSTTGTGNIVLVLVLPSNHARTILSLCHNQTCAKWDKSSPNSTSLGGWDVWYKTASAAGVHTVYHLDETVVFGLYVLRSGNGHGALCSAGFDLPRSEACATTLVADDDGIDNDCDGSIDEELKNYKDDDMDGKVDEDVKTFITGPTVFHGGWGVWSAWACWAPCSAASRYARYRLCERPSPLNGGRKCQGNEVEYSNRVCDFSTIPCFEDCPPKKWGPYCTSDCPRNCMGFRCDKATGQCEGCKPGRQGDFCNIKCSRFTFGAGCTQSCFDFCVRDCHSETGACDTRSSIVRTVYAILGLGVIPGAVICAGIYICRSQDPNRLALKAAIKSVNNHVIHVKLLAKAKEINEIELTRRKQKLGLEVESTKQRRKPKGDVAPAKQKSKKPKQMNILETLGSAASSFRNLLSPAQEGLEPSRKSTAL